MDLGSSYDARGNKLVSPVCRPHFGTGRRTIRRIFFVHMRKAGGSTIRGYLRTVAKRHNVTLDIVEGTPIEHPGNQTDTLYVTHIRHPVKRIISDFKYEARWPCLQLTRNVSYVPTLKNAEDFQNWINKTECHSSISPRYGQQLWLCSTNCYVQWLNFGFPKRGCNSDDIAAKAERYDLALSSLSKFHLIIDVDRLFRDAGYGSMLENYFGVRGLVGLKRNMYCGKKSAEANEKVPLMVENSTIENLYHRNQADLDLFHRYTTCEGIQFPSGNLSEFIGG
jgi:hypothetical protein